MHYKINTLYFSATGTTKKIVQTIANYLGGEQINEFDITLAQNRNSKLTFDKSDLVIFGLPVYAGRVPSFISDYLQTIKGDNSIAVCIALYGNRDYDDALLELSDIVKVNGFKVIAAGAFIGEHSYTKEVATNRPDEKDLKIANLFASEIAEKLSLINGFTQIKPLNIKGNRPYKPLGPSTLIVAPLTRATCIDCGICTLHCPTHAIDVDDVINVNATKCIHCFSCVKRCPVDAKYFKDDTIDKIVNFLIDNLSVIRKEPELF